MELNRGGQERVGLSSFGGGLFWSGDAQLLAAEHPLPKRDEVGSAAAAPNSFDWEKKVMSDSALRDNLPSPPGWLRAKLENGSRKAETALAFSGPQLSPEVETRTATVGQRDWSPALNLVREASEVVRMSEERVAELEAEMQELSAKASEGLRRLQAELHAGERRWANSEERARAAETRAKEAEAWLERLNEAIVTSFARSADPASTDERS